MRVNARFDGEAEQQVMYLAEMTGQGVSEVLRAGVQQYYDRVRAQRGGLRHFSVFVGQGDSGRSDVAQTYKTQLADGWADKHGTPRVDGAYPPYTQPAPLQVQEPAPAYRVERRANNTSVMGSQASGGVGVSSTHLSADRSRQSGDA